MAPYLGTSAPLDVGVDGHRADRQSWLSPSDRVEATDGLLDRVDQVLSAHRKGLDGWCTGCLDAVPLSGVDDPVPAFASTGPDVLVLAAHLLPGVTVDGRIGLCGDIWTVLFEAVSRLRADDVPHCRDLADEVFDLFAAYLVAEAGAQPEPWSKRHGVRLVGQPGCRRAVAPGAKDARRCGHVLAPRAGRGADDPGVDAGLPVSCARAVGRVSAMPGGVISIRRSRRWDICRDLYLAHGDDGTGRCMRCRIPAGTCTPRRSSGVVLVAAGVDLAELDQHGFGERTGAG